MRTGALLCFCCERPFAYLRGMLETVPGVGLDESRLDELCSVTMAGGGPPVEARGSRGLPSAVVGGGGGLPSAAASSAVAAPAVAFAAVAKAEAIAGICQSAIVAPVVSIGASSSSGSGGPPPAVAAGASGSGGPSPAVDVPPGSAKSISNELRKAAFGKSHTKGDWGKLWKAVKDRRKHQSFWDEDAEKRLQYSAGGMVRFTKGKTVNPWVAANAVGPARRTSRPPRSTSASPSSTRLLSEHARRARSCSRT